MSSQCPYPLRKKERWLFANVCQLLWTKLIHHKKNHYPLPLISRLLDEFSHAKVYTKIDLHGVHNMVRIQKGDEWKTTFKTPYGYFEYVAMPFGLINALFVFQHLMNDVFHEYLDDFMVCYIDDIFIFSMNMEDHECHVHLVLEKLQEVGFYAKLEKCEFHQSKVKFSGYIISRDGTCMDLHKVQTIVDWATPTSIQDV
jgi:hypothetical protein